MPEVSFYHLQREPLERALPKLLDKALERGMRAVVRFESDDRMQFMNRLLWTYDQDSFLPHGTAKDGNPDVQPVFLTTGQDNPNNANLLVLVDGAVADDMEHFDRCLDLFDGNDDVTVASARERWKSVKQSGLDATYWRQSEQGRWEKQG